jgi:AcrR family transcriptional regulator
MSNDKSDIRDQIVDAASSLFSRYGFRKATMDEIANTMGKGKSSIYYYFSSKEEIYEAVIEREAEFLRREVVKSISQAHNPKDKLRNYVLARMKTFRRVSNFYEAIRTEVVSHLDFIDRIRKKYDREEIRLLQDILEEGVRNNTFREFDPELTAIAIVTALKGLEIPMFWNKKGKNAEQQMEAFLNVLFHGIMQ